MPFEAQGKPALPVRILLVPQHRLVTCYLDRHWGKEFAGRP
jgi:hypothetical protein